MSTMLPVETDSTEHEQPVYSEDGVDLTLIRWMLSKTPWERLATLEQGVKSLLELRNGFGKPTIPRTPADAARPPS